MILTNDHMNVNIYRGGGVINDHMILIDDHMILTDDHINHTIV